MKAFENLNPRDVAEAVAALDASRRAGRAAAIAGGGSDLLGMMKERLVTPDVVVNLKAIEGLRHVSTGDAETRLGALVTLSTVGRHPVVRERYRALADAANSVGTPQIRNVGTLAGNVCQRPWCWYLRNGFPCYKNGGDRCFARRGENQFHAIFGDGPSYIVHPSDTAPALVALNATFRIDGPEGERTVPAQEFFVSPLVNRVRENVLQDTEVLTEVILPPSVPGRRSTYRKLLDRESWTHALVSAAVVLDVEDGVCRRARVALGGVAPVPLDRPAVARLLEGQRITPHLAERAAEAAVADARPLRKNGYKVPLTQALVRRTILELAGVSGAEE